MIEREEGERESDRERGKEGRREREEERGGDKRRLWRVSEQV